MRVVTIPIYMLTLVNHRRPIANGTEFEKQISIFDVETMAAFMFNTTNDPVFIDPRRSAERLLALVALGHTPSMGRLGMCLVEGTDGFDKDEKRAVAYFHKAAEMGDAVAQNHLGVALERGVGVVKDLQLAVFWFRQSAEQGFPIAQWHLGINLENGIGTAKDDAEAAKWYREAAESNHTEACCCYAATMLANGKGVAKNEIDAVYWWTKSAEKGYAPAQFSLGVCFHNGTGVKQNFKLAFHWYLKAAEQNIVESQTLVGQAYSHGIGVKQNHKKAAFWFRKASAGGNAQAQHNLAMMLAGGAGSVKDESKAVCWLRQAAAQGHAPAEYNLGLHYMLGTGGQKKDLQAAREWFRKSLDHGNHVATIELLFLEALSSSSEDNPVTRWGIKSREQMHQDLFLDYMIKDPVLLADSAFGQALRCKITAKGITRDFVVKVPKDPSLNSAWFNEYLALVSLRRHPNVLAMQGICPQYKCQDRNGFTFQPPISFVLPFCPQGSIVDFFAKEENRGKSTVFLRRWALDIARGLSHLHAHGRVHCDLAAGNVFLDESNMAIVGDLGHARPESTGATDGFVSIDASPHTRTTNTFTTASDIFSFGQVLFEIATECKQSDMFTFNTVSKAYEEVQALFEAAAAKGWPDLVKKLPPSMPASIKELMLRCLSFEPSQRPTALDIVLALDSTRYLAAPIAQLSTMFQGPLIKECFAMSQTLPASFDDCADASGSDLASFFGPQVRVHPGRFAAREWLAMLSTCRLSPVELLLPKSEWLKFAVEFVWEMRIGPIELHAQSLRGHSRLLQSMVSL